MISSSPRHDSVSSSCHSLRDEPSESCRWENRLGTARSHALLRELRTRCARCVSGPGTRTPGGPGGGGAGLGGGVGVGLGGGAARVRAAAADSPVRTGNRSEVQPEPAMEQPRKAVVVTGTRASRAWRPRRRRPGAGLDGAVREAAGRDAGPGGAGARSRLRFGRCHRPRDPSAVRAKQRTWRRGRPWGPTVRGRGSQGRGGPGKRPARSRPLWRPPFPGWGH